MDFETQIKYYTLATSVIVPVTVGIITYNLSKKKDFKMKQGELVSKLYLQYAELYEVAQDIMEHDADMERHRVAGKILMRNPLTTSVVDVANYHFHFADEKKAKIDELLDKRLNIFKEFNATLGTFHFYATKRDNKLMEDFSDKLKALKPIKIIIPDSVDINNIIPISHEILKKKLDDLYQNIQECTDLLEKIIER